MTRQRANFERRPGGVAGRMAAGGLLLALSPVLGIAILAIRATSRGPAFYRAKRMGRDGVPFDMLKLRSMRVDGAKGAAITAGQDSRVTTVGRLLRRSKLDEVPQLVNILRGEMAFIGPRPEAVEIVEAHYTPAMRAVLRQTPGLLSPGTLFNENNLDRLDEESDAERRYVAEILPRRVALDIAYEEKRTPWSDLGLIVATAKRLLSRSGKNGAPQDG